MSFVLFRRPYRLFVIAAALALLLCLLPTPANDVPRPQEAPVQQAQMDTAPAGADMSARTAAGCCLHETLFYAPCGHSVQRRSALPAQLTGLTRTALEAQLSSVLPGAAVTGFSETEVDVSRSADIPCPMHWVLRGGEDGMLHILQNKTGETLSPVRASDVPLERAPEAKRQELLDGLIFDDVQSLEGYLESLSS